MRIDNALQTNINFLKIKDIYFGKGEIIFQVKSPHQSESNIS